MLRTVLKKNIVVFIIPVIAAASSCEQREMPYVEKSGSGIILSQWQVDIGNGYRPSKPVPWDYPVEQGGINAAGFDGEGSYIAAVFIPVEFRTRQLALFIESVDDADETFLNGLKIGSTGKFPSGHEGPDGYVSAWRSIRLYPLPQDFIKYGSVNEIEIKVYDFSGRGGLAGNYYPEINDFSSLEKRVARLSIYNNVPRIVIITIMLYFFVRSLSLLILRFNTGYLRYIAGRISEELNPVFFVKMILGRRNPTVIFSHELKYSLLCTAVSLACFIIFIFFELTYKDSLDIAAHTRYHIFLLYVALIFLLMLLHRDVFTHNQNPASLKLKTARIAAGLLTHPFLLLCYFIYIHFIPENLVCNDFPARGGFIMAMIVACMIFKVLTHFIRISAGYGEHDHKSIRIFIIREDVLQLVALAGGLLSLVVFVTSNGALFTQSSVLASVFILFYLEFSIRIQVKRNALYSSLLIDDGSAAMRNASVEDKIKRVVEFIEQNYREQITRDDVAEATGMSGDHLSRIFKGYTGRNITDYINELRIKYAAGQLSETDIKIIEIAFDSGFNSVRTFNRAFVSYMKTNPRQYRVENRG